MATFYQYVKRHKFWAVVLILASLGVGYYFTRPPEMPKYETARVARGNVVQEVSVTGRVNAESEVELAFERGGRVSSVPVPVGEKVKQGDVLVRLDASELSALRAVAKANIELETANLSQLKRGTRVEDIAVSEAGVTSAEGALADARISLSDKQENAGTVADDAIFSKTDYLFDNPRTIAPRVLFPISDQNLVNTIEQTRAGLTLAIKQLNTPEPDFDKDLLRHKEYFSSVKNYLDMLASAISSVLPSSQDTQAEIDGWKLSVSTARTNMNVAISALLSAEQVYRSAESALLIAKNQLALKKAGPTADQIVAQEAKLRAMEANLDNYDAQIAKMVLTAPFSGVITRQDAKLGQTVTQGVSLVSLMSEGRYQIEVNVPEVDVAKIAVGDVARVTLDAYGADVPFPATVATIDPAETVLEGVSTYKVTLRFKEHDERIRSGMTANIDISTDKREDVLFIPLRAVITKDGKKTVRLLEGLTLREVEVVLGLRGSDGNVEVLEGVNDGDLVVTFIPK